MVREWDYYRNITIEEFTEREYVCLLLDLSIDLVGLDLCKTCTVESLFFVVIKMCGSLKNVVKNPLSLLFSLPLPPPVSLLHLSLISLEWPLLLNGHLNITVPIKVILFWFHCSSDNLSILCIMLI